MAKYLIDTHVHIHPSWNMQTFFDQTSANFAARATAGEKTIGVLFLAEANNSQAFHTLKTIPIKHWKISLTHDNHSLIAKNENTEILIIAGKQIISQENLEILTIGTTATCKPNLSVREIIQWGKEHDTLIIIPWGVGKWLGKRSLVIKSLLKDYLPNKFFIGDNGNRPAIWKSIGLFQYAQKKNFIILGGSDPLPLKSEINKAGSFGIITYAKLSKDMPGSDLLTHLKKPSAKIIPYGKLSNLYQFLTKQISLRLKLK